MKYNNSDRVSKTRFMRSTQKKKRFGNQLYVGAPAPSDKPLTEFKRTANNFIVISFNYVRNIFSTQNLKKKTIK